MMGAMGNVNSISARPIIYINNKLIWSSNIAQAICQAIGLIQTNFKSSFFSVTFCIFFSCPIYLSLLKADTLYLATQTFNIKPLRASISVT